MKRRVIILALLLATCGGCRHLEEARRPKTMEEKLDGLYDAQWNQIQFESNMIKSRY